MRVLMGIVLIPLWIILKIITVVLHLLRIAVLIVTAIPVVPLLMVALVMFFPVSPLLAVIVFLITQGNEEAVYKLSDFVVAPLKISLSALRARRDLIDKAFGKLIRIKRVVRVTQKEEE